jgi:hypothetical protein
MSRSRAGRLHVGIVSNRSFPPFSVPKALALVRAPMGAHIEKSSDPSRIVFAISENPLSTLQSGNAGSSARTKPSTSPAFGSMPGASDPTTIMQAFKLLSITAASLVGAALLASVDHSIGFCVALAFLLCLLAVIAFSLFILQLVLGFHPTTRTPRGY